VTPEEIAVSFRRSAEIESGKPLVVFKVPAVSDHGTSGAWYLKLTQWYTGTLTEFPPALE
jgi:hypothetical protein